jgi:hypothetical protein
MKSVIVKNALEVSVYAKDTLGRVLATYVPQIDQYIVYTDMVCGVLCGEVSLSSDEVYVN